MPSPIPERRLTRKRNWTWPPAVRVIPPIERTHEVSPGLQPRHSPTVVPKNTFEDELQHRPEEHFLSPIQRYEYEDWSDDEDEDASDVAWDAGITDFALFDNDRRQAENNQQALPSKWNHVLAAQSEALRRSEQRKRADTGSSLLPTSPSDEDVPHLTPDTSPYLHDDLDEEISESPTRPISSVPNYLTVTLTPPEEDLDDETIDQIVDDIFADDEDDDDQPIMMQPHRRLPKDFAPAYRMERPGLRYSRTQSGKRHVWRRPSWYLYTVGENPEAEQKAELATIQRIDSMTENHIVE